MVCSCAAAGVVKTTQEMVFIIEKEMALDVRPQYININD